MSAFAARTWQFIGVLLGAVFVLSFKFVDIGCAGFVFYLCATVLIIYLEVSTLRSRIKEHLCDTYLRRGTFIYYLCRGKILGGIISFVVSIFIACSTLLFIFLLEPEFMAVLLLDVVFFVYLFSSQKADVNSYLSVNARDAYAALLQIIMNSMLLCVIYYVFDYYTAEVYEFMSTEIVDITKSTIVHSCRDLQNVARTAYAFELNIHSMRSLEGVGMFVSSFFYLITVSIIPFVGFSMLLSRTKTLGNMLSKRSHD